MKQLTLVLVSILMVSPMSGGVYLFEDKAVPPSWSAEGGRLEITERVYKEGRGSLQWEFEPGGRILIEGPMGVRKRPEDAANNALSTFAYWIYSPESKDDSLVFTFYTAGRELGSFAMSLDFKGWRSAWIRYEWDIGEGIDEDPDQLVITAPDRAGTVYWDLLVTSAELDSRSPVPDRHVPFVGQSIPSRPNDIWNSLHDFREDELKVLRQGLSSNNAQGDLVESRWSEAFDDLYGIGPRNAPDFDAWASRLAQWNLSRVNNAITGNPIFFASQFPLLEGIGIPVENDLRDFGRLLLDGAIGRTFSDGSRREEWGEALLLMVDHLLEQGWTDGSGQGVLHHLGYSMRELYRGLYLLRDLLEEEEKLEPVRDMISWYSGTGRVVSGESVMPSMDVFNTQLEGILISILLHPDQGSRDLLLGGLSGWLADAIMVQPGILPVFKEDGSVYHHQGHYPAYANGGFRGLGPVLYALGETPYALDEDAFSVLKEALLAYRFYSNQYHWPRSISGRHPDGTWIIHEEAFYWIARARRSGIDHELASAYLRLGRDARHLEFFREKGLESEAFPSGTKTMPWAGITVHRKNGWMALVRGFSRYLWSHETYRGANLFGRYLSHGQLELLHRGDPVNPLDSGFDPAGWDWFHLPGATNPVADYHYLRADILNLDDVSGYEEMLLSREAFNGGVASDRGGIHAFKLAGHAKYDDDLRARKSYTFSGDWIICLGSDIRSETLPYPVHTTLFQVALQDGRDWEPELVHLDDLRFGDKAEGVLFLKDPTGVGYLLPAESSLEWDNAPHLSPHQKTEVMETGRPARAWINHGRKPVDGRYQYAIYMNGRPASGDLPFSILRQDERAHIIVFNDGFVTHAFFEADVRGAGDTVSPVLGVNAPCLVQTAGLPDGTLSLSIANPDLALYEHDGNQWSGDGEQLEVSIYSRPWQGTPATPVEFEIRLNGLWNTEEALEGIQCIHLHGETILRLSITGGGQEDLRLVQGTISKR